MRARARGLLPALLLALPLAGLLPGLAGAPGAAMRTGDEMLPAGLHYYTGDLHAHSGFSDGAGTPQQAYAAARAHGLDFFATTEHSELLDLPYEAARCAGDADPAGCLAASPLPGTKWARLGAAAQDATVPGVFLGLRGFEETMDIEGHVNVFGSAGYTDRALSGDATMAPFWAWFTGTLPPVELPDGHATSGLDGLGQFNHPASDKNPLPDQDSYRWDDFAHIPAADARMVGIEVFNGAATSHAQWYSVALDHGWHVAPTAVSDTHRDDWGDPRYGRTLVVAPALDAPDLRAALLARRTVATMDPDLRLLLSSGEHLLGDRWSVPAGAAVPLHIRVAGARSPVTLVEVVTNGGVVAASGAPDATGGFTAEVAPSPGAERYYFARVTEADGTLALTAPVWLTAG